MFKTRDFLPVIITALLVIVFAIGTLASSNACVGDWTCWFTSSLQILIGRYQPPPGVHASGTLLVLTEVGGKAILLVGAFLSTVRIVISALRHDFRTALARRMRNHTIVCGLGETGMQVVRNMLSAGEKVVVIERADDSIGNGASCDRQGIPLIRGDATSFDMLVLAGVHHARTIIVCTGDDVSNMDVALHIKDLVRDQQPGLPPLVVLAEMRNQWLFSRLVNHDRYALGSDAVDLRLFNINENAARVLLKSVKAPPGPEIESGAFVILGFGPLGQQVMLHLIRASFATIESQPKIIIFDRAAEQCQRRFTQTYPAAAKLADVSFIEAAISPDSPESWITVESTVRTLPLLGVAICFDDDQTGLYAGLSMRRVLDNLSRIHVPIFLRLGQARHLGQFAATMESLKGQPERFKVFGGLDELLGFDILVRGELDALAKSIHAQYRDSRQLDGLQSSANEPWNMLPETLKMSNRRRADNMPFLLAQAGLHMAPSATPAPFELSHDEIELLARLEHRRWVIERRLLGFSYGAVRSEFPPRHELLVAWDQLPEAERERNRKDFANLPKVLAEASFGLWREQKILAVETRFATALPQLERAIANKDKGCVVIADIDSIEGRKAAGLALNLADSALWLVSSQYPLEFTDMQQLGTIFKDAAGWITREQFHGA
jgi:hypothetical protein